MKFGKRNIGLILAAFILVGLLHSFQSAYALGSEKDKWRSTWNVEADFDGNRPNVVLAVIVERKTGIDWSTFAEERRKLDCEVGSGVQLVGNAAVFDGTDGIRCDMPSIQNMVSHMTGGAYAPDVSCDCAGSPIIKADVHLNPNTTSSDLENPLFHRVEESGSTDMALAAPVPAHSTVPQASMIFTVGAETAQSNPFLANQPVNDLLATYFNIGGMHQATFVANGANPGTGAAPVPSLSVTNEATTLFLGYSPVTGAAFDGVLIRGEVDPGCYGTG